MSEHTMQMQVVQAQPQALDAVGRKSAIDDLLNKVALVMETMKSTMRDGEHFGKIPGCGEKPALLKAGAEKLGMVFRIKPSFDVDERDLGKGHREYFIKCRLSDGTEGVGSCSTMESKYRFRKAERSCPSCGKATIRQSKKDEKHPKGGFYCWAKIGGCGLQFDADDDRIIGQETGRQEHDNPADYYNTCLKMAKKRAHVDAIITATACSDIFTQDVEEIIEAADATATTATASPVVPAPSSAAAAAAPKQEKPSAAPKQNVVDATEVFPCCQVLEVKEVHSKPDAAKKWTAYFVKFNDGVGDTEAATFDTRLADSARQFAGTHDDAKIVTKPGKKANSRELVSITFAGPGDAAPSTSDDNVPMNFDAQGQPVEEVTP